jgi:hypothetical protein
MKDNLKAIGGCLSFALIATCFFALTGLFFVGAARFGDIILPWLFWISAVGICLCIVVYFPLSFFRFSRGFTAIGLLITSYVFGATLWVWCLLIAYSLWGLMAVLIGVLFMGIGVVPIAMLAMLFHGEWSTLGQVVLLAFFTWATRFWSFALVVKEGNEAQSDYV